MPVALITSTMKSDPARPPSGDITFGISVSAAICRAVGGMTAGNLAVAVGGVAALALLEEVTAAPVTATPARNLRRLTSECGSFRAISISLIRITPFPRNQAGGISR